jgi:hypothetical protein
LMRFSVVSSGSARIQLCVERCMVYPSQNSPVMFSRDALQRSCRAIPPQGVPVFFAELVRPIGPDARSTAISSERQEVAFGN